MFSFMLTLTPRSVYRPRLERRLTRLEKMLNIPMSDHHKCDGQLKEARDLYVEGIRIKNKTSPFSWDKTSQGAGVPIFSSQIAEVSHIRQWHPFQSDSLCVFGHRPTRTSNRTHNSGRAKHSGSQKTGKKYLWNDLL